MSINNGNNFHGMKPFQPINPGKESVSQQHRDVVVDREAVFRSIKNMWQPIADYFKDPATTASTDKMPEQIVQEINGYMNISSNIATVMNSSGNHGSFDAYI